MSCNVFEYIKKEFDLFSHQHVKSATLVRRIEKDGAIKTVLFVVTSKVIVPQSVEETELFEEIVEYMRQNSHIDSAEIH